MITDAAILFSLDEVHATDANANLLKVNHCEYDGWMDGWTGI